MNAIEINNISKKYKEFELKNVTLTLPGGCIMGLIGENGAGKSTLIKLVLDMIKNDTGEIKILGKSNKDFTRLIMEDVGVVFDELCLPDSMNAKQINDFMKHIYKNWEEDSYFKLLERLKTDIKKPLKILSRGNKMKVSIAVALSHGAKLLILDEATSGLDPVVRDEIVDILMEYTKDDENSILMSSHIVSDLEKACDYIAFLHNGKLIMCDEKDVLKDKYRIVKCTEEELSQIDEKDIVGKKIYSYGAEAMVREESVPKGMINEKISVEDLFIYTVKNYSK